VCFTLATPPAYYNSDGKNLSPDELSESTIEAGKQAIERFPKTPEYLHIWNWSRSEAEAAWNREPATRSGQRMQPEPEPSSAPQPTKK